MSAGYDPGTQARVLATAVARARNVSARFNWGSDQQRGELEESFKTMIEAAEGMMMLQPEIAREMQGSAYACVTALNEFCADLEMVMERIPGLRRET